MERTGGRMVVSAMMILCFLASTSLAKVSLYLSSDQTEALYGIKTDGLYYVREGVVNKYAMNFQHQVKPRLLCDKNLYFLLKIGADWRKADMMACLGDHATPRRYIEPQ